MTTVFLGLGSNIGDRGQNIQDALVALEKWGVKIVRNSSLYEAEPFGDVPQEWFMNMVIKGETALSPEDLLKAIDAIEKSLKRIRVEKWGPRTMDIDILWYGDEVIDRDGLHVPHPGVANRRFVLVPLVEIAPDLVHPELQKTAQELLNGCEDRSIVNLHQ